MARAPSLGLGLTPFGGGGVNFGAFNIVDPSQGPYLAFLKVENAWSNGKATDADYLAAMQTYASALPAGSSNRLGVEQRIIDTTYRVNRNTLVHQIETGAKQPDDLVTFDKAAMDASGPGSQDFLGKQDLYWNSQQAVFSRAEQQVAKDYQNGLITSAALQSWYREQGARYGDNPQLGEAIGKQVVALDSRILDERDANTIRDYNAGKMGDDQFILYAQAARARYAAGTSQASEWDQKIDAAKTQKSETGLLYRYGLSQQYAQLEQFVKSNSGKTTSGSGGSTSTSSRIVLGADGKWHTVTTTTAHAGAGPSPAAVKAYHDLQIQLADAKKQMAEIVGRLGSTPGGGGFVQTDSMISYYSQRQASLTPGSADWYALQTKIDSLNQQKHQETVLAKEGIKITYPGAGTSSSGGSTTSGGSSSPTTGSGSTARSSVSLDSFMSAVAKVESGGSYTATNKSSGAYGKYQIMPANWSAWAQQAGLPASAPQTPENQELVAKHHMAVLYKKYGSWEAVAYVWNTGARPTAAMMDGAWSGYVGKVMGNLGLTPSKIGQSGAGTSTTSGVPKPPAVPSAPKPSSTQGKVGGLSTVVSVGDPTRTGPGAIKLSAAGFPVNLDGSAFTNFYNGYERAFKNGDESFSFGGATYFVGLNASDRIDRMRQLDDLSVGFYKTKLAYLESKGLSTSTTSAALASAVKDLVSHEYLILDTIASKQVISPVIGADGKPTYDKDGKPITKTTLVRPKGAPGSGGPESAINPIAAGYRMLTQTQDAIKGEIAAAQAAYDRGDINGAMSHLQIANNINSPTTEGLLSGYASSAQQAIAAIQKASGMTFDQALNESMAGKLKTELTSLEHFQPEIDAALQTGTALQDTIKSQVVTDANGHAKLDGRGQVQLSPDFARFADENGKITIGPKPVGGVDKSGAPDGFAAVTVRVGNTVETVYAKWKMTGKGNGVGYIMGPDGVTKNYIAGKMVTLKVNGQTTTYYNDPLNPTHWTTSPIVYQPPKGFVAGVDKNGNATYSFAGVAPSPKSGAPSTDGITFTLSFDQASGTYIVLANRPGGLLQSEIKDQVWGIAGAPEVADLFSSAGLSRQGGSASGDPTSDVIGNPIFGMTPDEYKAWLKGQVPPGARELNAPQYTGANPLGTHRNPLPQYTGANPLGTHRPDAAPPQYTGKAMPGEPAPAPAATPTIKPLYTGANPLPTVTTKAPALPAVKAPVGGNIAKTSTASPTVAPKPAPAPVKTPVPVGGNTAKVGLPTIKPLPKLPPPPTPVPVGGNIGKLGL